MLEIIHVFVHLISVSNWEFRCPIFSFVYLYFPLWVWIESWKKWTPKFSVTKYLSIWDITKNLDKREPIRGCQKFGIKIYWRLQFLEYMRTLNSKFRKDRTKIEVALTLPCWLSQINYSLQYTLIPWSLKKMWHTLEYMDRPILPILQQIHQMFPPVYFTIFFHQFFSVWTVEKEKKSHLFKASLFSQFAIWKINHNK